MNTPLRLIALAAWSLTATGAAQDPPTPVSDALRSAAGRAASNFIAAAEAMPAGRYGFKPTPAQMSFGDVIAHMSAGNDALCSSIGGLAAPKRSDMAAGAPKDQLVALGQVGGLTKTTLDIPVGMRSADARVRLLADPIGGTGPITTPELVVPAGQTVYWTIGSDAATSSASAG
jgi:hypothetical protein